MKHLNSFAVILMIAVFLVSITPLTIVPTTATVELPDYEPIDIGPWLREKNLPIDMSLPEIVMPEHHSYYEVGDIIYWLALDDYMGYYFFTPYELRAIGDVCEIWVQVDLSWPEGDPRAYPTILDEQVAYLLEEFETKIYPIDVEYFGEPDTHCGDYAALVAWGYVPEGYYYEETGRNVILVSNVRDENYYDYEYPYYIAGFYSGSFEFYFDRNIISIDTWQWERRIGPEGYEWIPGVPVTRPYLYESTIAHEYQHLIHADYNPDDPSFMNEGCSMYAEILCGYGVSWSHVNSYLATPDNSLTEWGDQGGINILADYGAATLWAIYLSDHYGGAAFLSYFVQAGIPGIEGINAALEHFEYKERFDDVYHDWRIANLIHTDTPGEGRYNYVTIDLGGPEAIPARTYDIKTPLVSPRTGTSFGSTITILGYDTGVYKIGSYGSDYIKFTGLNDKFEPILLFDGDDAAGAFWIREDMDGDGDLEWYSTTAGNLADLSIIAEVTLPTETVMLTFDTYYDIEDFWDFGFVQVSTDGGETWTSLENEYTTCEHDPDAHPDIVANLPGLTGWSEDWITMSFDLSDYAGLTVLIGFRYMTDWAVQYPGWWVDNIKINEEIIDDADTTVIFYTPLPEVDFMVTLIGVEIDNGMPKYKLVEDVTLDDLTESGMMALNHFIEKGYVLLIISPNQGPADYLFEVKSGRVPKGGGRMIKSTGSSTTPIWVTESDGNFIWVEAR